MDVLVRIDVCGIRANQPPKLADLALDFELDGTRIVERDHLVERFPIAFGIGPFAQVEV